MKQLRLLAIAVALTFTAARAYCADAPPATSPTPAATHPAAPAPAPEAAAEKPAARREDAEPKTLAESLGLLKSARSDRDRAETDLAAAEVAHDKTKQLLKSTTEIATKSKADLEAAATNLTALSAERDREKTAHAKTQESLTLAEAALGVRGISSAEAVAAGAEASAGNSALDKFLKATPGERAALIRKDGDAIYAEAKTRGVSIG